MDNVALFVVGLGAGIGAAALALAVRAARRCASPPRVTASALRCSICGVDWPANAGDYSHCPACLEPTDPVGGIDVHPLGASQARSIRLHHEFERFYAAWKGREAA